jgi:hypothetical protein
VGVINIVESYTDEELAEVNRMLAAAGVNVTKPAIDGKPPKYSV